MFQDGKSVVYASRSLTETEQWYSNRERERERAVECCLCPGKIPSLLVWLYSDCSYIENLKGKENVTANPLSRVSPQPVRESKVDRDVIPVHMFTEEIHADTESRADFQNTTADDMISGPLMQAVING